jgi:hypothetical protein
MILLQSWLVSVGQKTQARRLGIGYGAKGGVGVRLGTPRGAESGLDESAGKSMP